MPIAFAIAAAFGFATAGVTAKRGIQHTNIVTALLISLSVTAVVTAVFVAFDPPHSFFQPAIALFAAAGVMGDGIGRASFFGAVDRLGPSTATPIQTASYPLIALIGGILVFSETVTLWQVAGVAAIVAGIWALAGDISNPGSRKEEARGKHRWTWELLLPVAAGAAFGFSDLFRKSGLNEIPNPAFGALLAAITVLFLWAIVAISVPGIRRQLKPGPGWQWLIATGAFTGLALLAVFSALDRGDVSVVGPIINTQPIAVVVLSAVLLRDIERVTWRMVVGAVFAVAGVILIAVGS